MALVTWSENFSVGIAQFDNEHKKLIDMLNTLHDAMREGKGKTILSNLLNDLTTYVSTHFSNEEKFMLANNYPQYTIHKKDHEDFAKKVLEYTTLHANGLFSANQLSATLRDWLLTHISDSDKKYGDFFNNK
jgi:hemerythrin-like metal-binding domain